MQIFALVPEAPAFFPLFGCRRDAADLHQKVRSKQ